MLSDLFQAISKFIYFQNFLPSLFKLSKRFNGLVKGEFEFKSDNEFNDFYSYWEKIRQHSPLCLPATFPLVSSVRKSSFRLEVNPAISELKSVSLKLKLCKYIINIERDNF